MRVEELERELRAERPEPSLDFARRLDEWAEAGFPRDRGLGPRTASRSGALHRAWDRLTSIPPRRVLLPAGAVATVVVVAGVAISRNAAEPTELAAPDAAAPQAQGSTPANPPRAADVQSAAGAAEAAPAPGQAAGDEFSLTVPAAPSGGDHVARGTDERIVDATARITLGADADEVQGVVNGVNEVADRYGAIVESSQVSSDQAGARASIRLQVPSKNLEAALADLSGLADVISRTEGAEDITARAVRARKELAGTLEQIGKARIELIKADTREQKLVIRSQIASLEASADAQRTALNGVKRQGRFATVDVDVTSNGPASDGGSWSIGDALDDAGTVLETIGGIALVSLAILLPLSLLAALAAFAVSRGRKRSRDNALDRKS
ncbi:MAG TPA: DUF4349 domain-containing protein [Solirubrobacterales bacterium]